MIFDSYIKKDIWVFDCFMGFHNIIKDHVIKLIFSGIFVLLDFMLRKSLFFDCLALMKSESYDGYCYPEDSYLQSLKNWLYYDLCSFLWGFLDDDQRYLFTFYFSLSLMDFLLF